MFNFKKKKKHKKKHKKKMKLFLLFFICIFKLNYSIKDSLNFILSPLGKECFFEDIEAGLGARSIEIFVPSGSNLNIQLEVSLFSLFFNFI